METQDPNVYPTILGGVSRDFWTPFLNRGAESAISWHLKTGTFAKSIQELVIYCQHLQYHQSPYLQQVVCADMRVDWSWDKATATGSQQHIHLANIEADNVIYFY